MGFLSRLIGVRGKRPQGFPVPAKPDWITGGINYDPDLVGKLKREHEELARIFSSIKSAAAECRFQQLPELLSDLKLAFQTHIMLENVKFYVYVQHCCASDPDTSDFISEVRKDMDGIARRLVRFVNTHSNTLPTLDNVSNFRAELDEIGNVLMWRVQLEEQHLYGLYQPKS